MNSSYQNLESRFRQISHLNEISSIIAWDEAVMMPKGASHTRHAAMADLAQMIQSMSMNPQIGEWLDEASETTQLNTLTPWQKANVREMRRIYTENTVIPADLNHRFSLARMKCENAWRTLRAENNWTAFKPLFQEVLILAREVTQILGEVADLPLYDAALNRFSPGLTSSAVQKLFDELKRSLPSLIQVANEKQKRVVVPQGPFPMEAQKALAKELMSAIGFAMDNGRLDESHHPFCGGTARDVRITTRYNDREFISSLMGVLHETGHGLYEQGLPEEWLGQPVGMACGMAVHESQSLFMEMQICRSRAFMEFAAPYIAKHMRPHCKNPESLNADNLYLLVTELNRENLIRVDADEVTYPLHVILRYEIERDLLEDRWSLDNLPEVWNEKMQSYLGLSTTGNDKNGCMQDVHWPSGAFGYFPAYTFGAVIAAQLFSKILEENPRASQQIASGNLSEIQTWLRTHIWNQGSFRTTMELVEKASGPLSSRAFKMHLEKRYLS